MFPALWQQFGEDMDVRYPQTSGHIVCIMYINCDSTGHSFFFWHCTIILQYGLLELQATLYECEIILEFSREECIPALAACKLHPFVLCVDRLHRMHSPHWCRYAFALCLKSGAYGKLVMPF